MAYDQAGKERKLQLQELEELCLEACENSQIYKQKVKQFNDHKILRKEFKVGQKVLLFNSRFKLITSKLCSRWDVELRDGASNKIFQVNGHQLKHFPEGPTQLLGKGGKNVQNLISSIFAPLLLSTAWWSFLLIHFDSFNMISSSSFSAILPITPALGLVSLLLFTYREDLVNLVQSLECKFSKACNGCAIDDTVKKVHSWIPDLAARSGFGFSNVESDGRVSSQLSTCRCGYQI
ncbi:hypothetical protein CR513_12338, partial [Mucuna pruriens]